jgi:hypothetical protein
MHDKFYKISGKCPDKMNEQQPISILQHFLSQIIQNPKTKGLNDSIKMEDFKNLRLQKSIYCSRILATAI